MEPFNLDTPLIDLSADGDDCYWTARHAVEGVQIFGGIGSGKSSGSGRMLALKYLAAGFGGLVLTVKPGEREMWEGYLKDTGRYDDRIVVEPDGKNFFNFLDYEMTQSKTGMTENVVEVLKTVIRASEEKDSGGADDPFWETALDMLIFNVIDLCRLAYGTISIQLMYQLVQTMPKPGHDPDMPTAFNIAFKQARNKVDAQIKEWQSQQTYEVIKSLTNETIYTKAITEALADVRVLNFVDQFFNGSFLNLAEKTRSIIEFSFSGFLFRLLRDPVYPLFCQHPSTFTPEDCSRGKIIILDLPVKLYQKAGRDCQIMFKYIWQRAMEKRAIDKYSLPVFLWADEAQNFIHEHDADYQATARSSMIATVYISQNLPNYLANMGGAKSDFKVKSFLGTLATKIFHANADIETNKYSSELIGDDLRIDVSQTDTASGQFTSSRTKSVKVDRLIRPEEFALLKTGGPVNNNRVEGYMHIQGNTLGDKSHIKILFNQNFIPNQNPAP